MSPPELALGVCRHCEQTIRQFELYPNGPKQWLHVDGSHAYPECRNLKAEPKEQ